MEDYDKIKKVLALGFMHFLDENRTEGKMCLSNGECADIDKAFNEQDWSKLARYLDKYLIDGGSSEIPNDLEEAAWDCVLDSVDVNNPVLLPKYKELLLYLFIAGAKWQKCQMMKGAVEGEVIVPIYEGYDTWSSEIKIPGRYEIGDKVRIIIVKED